MMWGMPLMLLMEMNARMKQGLTTGPSSLWLSFKRKDHIFSKPCSGIHRCQFWNWFFQSQCQYLCLCHYVWRQDTIWRPYPKEFKRMQESRGQVSKSQHLLQNKPCVDPKCCLCARHFNDPSLPPALGATSHNILFIIVKKHGLLYNCRGNCVGGDKHRFCKTVWHNKAINTPIFFTSLGADLSQSFCLQFEVL